MLAFLFPSPNIFALAQEVLCAPAPSRHQLSQEGVRPHLQHPSQEEAEVDLVSQLQLLPQEEAEVDLVKVNFNFFPKKKLKEICPSQLLVINSGVVP